MLSQPIEEIKECAFALCVLHCLRGYDSALALCVLRCLRG